MKKRRCIIPYAAAFSRREKIHMTNITICGANGKMGHTIYQCVQERSDCRIISGSAAG